MLKLGEVGFQTRNITGDKNGHYLRIKRSIHQEGITYRGFWVQLNTEPLNVWGKALIKFKGEMDNSTINFL